jgi:hypothetical protein
MNDTNRKTVVARAATLTQFAISVLFSNPIAYQPPHPHRHHIEKDKPSEYVQSVDGHGRQHDTFPTRVGVGRQRRPGISRGVSTFCRREARQRAQERIQQHTPACRRKLRLLKERSRTVPLQRHCMYRRASKSHTVLVPASSVNSEVHDTRGGSPRTRPLAE